jgi:hypothetical protein
VIEMPCNHNLEQFLHEYIDAAGIGGEKASPLFRSTRRKTKILTDKPLFQQNVYDIIQGLAAGRPPVI